MKLINTILATLFFVASAQAQSGMLPSSDVKSLGMGGVRMTTLSGSDVLYGNAALGTFARSGGQFSALYYGKRENYYAVTGAARLGMNSTILAGWRQYKYETQGHDMALDLGYARRINDRWSIGATLRYMRLDNFVEPGNPAKALSVDLSAAFVLPLENLGASSSLRAGARLGNLGGCVKGSDMTLPMDIMAGVALDTFLSDAHEITLAADAGYFFTPSAVRSFQGSVGAEYNLMQMIKFRAGYHVNGADSNLSYGSFGAGVQFLFMRLDFAYLLTGKGSPLRDTYGLNFGVFF